MKENHKDDGYPEISQDKTKNKYIVYILFPFLILSVFSFYLFGKANKSEIKQVEENYTIESSHSIKSQSSDNGSLMQQGEQSAKEPTQPISQEQIDLIREKQKELQERLSAPVMVVNNIQTNHIDQSTQPKTVSSDRNTQFMNQVASQSPEAVKASSITDMSTTIAEGSLIHAILESATNSDLPGFVRAVISAPSYSEDGTHILIPSGSRLIGQYKSGMLQGQSRIFMVWTRVITPNGVSVQLGSPGVDSMGMAGIGADEVNRHFWQRFGTASLLSIIGTGSTNFGTSATDLENPISAYRNTLANNFAQSAEQSLQQDGKIPPTLITYQGKPIIVFVAHDIHFEGTLPQISRINIF